jgi:hypothetical protein
VGEKASLQDEAASSSEVVINGADGVPSIDSEGEPETVPPELPV